MNPTAPIFECGATLPARTKASFIMRIQPILLAFSLFPMALVAQTDAGQQAAFELLSGGNYQQWSQIGTSATTMASCASGDRLYVFKMKPAQVVVQECVNGTFKPRTLPLTGWTKDGRSGVAFDGISYEVKQLRGGAPVCKGNANCIRLASMPDGKTDATTTIYLTR